MMPPRNSGQNFGLDSLPGYNNDQSAAMTQYNSHGWPQQREDNVFASLGIETGSSYGVSNNGGQYLLRTFQQPSNQLGSLGEVNNNNVKKFLEVPARSQRRFSDPPNRMQNIFSNDPWTPLSFQVSPSETYPQLDQQTYESNWSSYRNPPHSIDTSSDARTHSDSHKISSNTSVEPEQNDQDCQDLHARFKKHQVRSEPTNDARSLVHTPGSAPGPSQSKKPRQSGRKRGQPLACERCGQLQKCQSELKKHLLKHDKPFKCDYRGCGRSQGFTTINDLNRHKNSVHELKVGSKVKRYRCKGRACRNPAKVWSRLDNFKQHVGKMHKDENMDEIVNRSLERTITTPVPAAPVQVSIPMPETEAMLVGMEPGQSTTVSQNDDTAESFSLTPEHPKFIESPDYNGFDISGNFGMFGDMPMERFLPGIAVEREQLEKASVQEHRSQSMERSQTMHRSGPARPNRSTASKSVDAASNVSGHDPGGLSYSTQKNLVPAIAYPEVMRSDARSLSQMTGNSSDGSVPERHHRASAKQPDVEERVLADIMKGLNSENQSIMDACQSNRPDGTNVKDTIKAFVKDILKDMAVRIPDDGKATSNGSVRSKRPSNTIARFVGIQESNRSSVEGFQFDDAQKSTMAEPRFNNSPPRLDHDDRPFRDPKDHDGHGSSKGPWVCNRCKDPKEFPRQSEYKKHQKRHDRPYGCTFSDCDKCFGSKNDWKRHENSQHFQQEMWRCRICAAEKRPPLVYIAWHEDMIQDHLRDVHRMTDETSKKDEADKCKIGRNNQGQFWCGFCEKIVPLEKKGVEAWDERFKHIDEQHFKKEQKTLKWLCPMKGKTKEELEVESKKSKRPYQDDDDCDDDSRNDDSSEATSADRETPKAKPAATNMHKELQKQAVGLQQQQKRKRDHYDSDYFGTPGVSAVCCGCGNAPLDLQLHSHCFGCNHKLCNGCIVRE